MAIVACAVLGSEKLDSAAGVKNLLATHLSLASLILSVVTTVISTTLIVYRILSLSHSSSLTGSSSSSSSALHSTIYRVIEIVIESAVLSSVAGIIMLPVMGLGLTDIALSTSATTGVVYVEVVFGYAVVSTRIVPA
jgi:hypothetical protein